MNYSMLKSKTRIILLPLVNLFAKLNVNPSILTLVGFVINCLAAYLFALGFFRWAGLVLILASIFDAIDGEVARKNNRVTDSGAFLDSVIDRYSEFIVLLGIFIHYIKFGSTFFIFVTLFSILGSLMVSYTRARAEGLGIKCSIGLFDRPFRVTIIVIGALLGRTIFGYFLLALAFLTQLTSLHRIIYIEKKLTNIQRRKNV